MRWSAPSTSGLSAGILIALLAALSVSWWSIRRGLQPLDLLARAALARAGAPEAAPLPVHTLPAELQPIGSTLERAFSQLNHLLQQERRFARDVAHELRTPLAEIRALADAAAASSDPVEVRQHIAEIALSAQGLAQSVGALLSLERVEAGLERSEEEPLELVALIEQCLRTALHDPICRSDVYVANGSSGASPVATYTSLLRQQRGSWPVGTFRPEQRTCHGHGERAVDSTLPGECWISSDPALLAPLLANLLGNAVEYTLPNAPVRLHLETDAEHAALTISNAAAPISEDELAQLGQAGVRLQADDSRHAGRGLLIARGLAVALQLDLLDYANGCFSARLAGLRLV